MRRAEHSPLRISYGAGAHKEGLIEVLSTISIFARCFLLVTESKGVPNPAAGITAFLISISLMLLLRYLRCILC